MHRYISGHCSSFPQDGIDPVCVGAVALAGTEVKMESRQCRMCMCEANHEEKEQRLTASEASSAVIGELVMYDNMSFLYKKLTKKN